MSLSLCVLYTNLFNLSTKNEHEQYFEQNREQNELQKIKDVCCFCLSYSSEFLALSIKKFKIL